MSGPSLLRPVSTFLRICAAGWGFRLYGSSSGYVGVKPASAAGSVDYTLPSADGTSGQALVTNGSGVLSFTTISSTSYSAGTGLTLASTTFSVNASQTQITALGTIGTGVWQGTLVGATYGGTGVNNGSNTLTLSGGTVTLTLSGATNVTLPTSGTLAALGGTNTWTGQNTFNKDAAASTPGTRFIGNFFAGTGTTSFPVVYFESGSPSAITSWPTGGTLIGGLVSNSGFSAANVMTFKTDTGTTLFSLSGQGAVTANQNFTAGTNFTLSSNTGVLQFRGGLSVVSSPATNTIQIGTTDAASPSNQILCSQGVASGTSNVTGSTLTIQPGNGRGTGGSGSLIFQTAPTGSTGSTANTMTTALTIDNAQAATFAGNVTVSTGKSLTARIASRTGTTTSSATPTINTDNVDEYYITAQAVDITSMTTNLSGTPNNGQPLFIAITGTAARAITWGTGFETGPVSLPTTTVTTQRLDIWFKYNSVTSKWRCMASGSA